MITHYGLFWSERDVFWGRPKNPGEMTGRERDPLDRRGAPKTDEKKVNDYRNFVGLYCLYGNGELLYVGEAGLETGRTLFGRTLFDRLKEHRKGALSGRWDKFSWFGREKCENSTSVQTALKQLEAIVIAIVNPGFNKQSGAFKDATQVFQVPHKLSEGTIETKIDIIYEMVEELKNGIENRDNKNN